MVAIPTLKEEDALRAQGDRDDLAGAGAADWIRRADLLALDREPAGRGIDDPGGFACEGVELAATLVKYSLWKRPLQELEYARPLIRRMRGFRPDCVVSANTPLIAQARFLVACRRERVPFVFWQQDVHGLAMQAILRDRLPLGGAGIGRLFPAIERTLLRRSDAVVTIAPEFAAVAESWGVARERLSVIENWAPLDELPEAERNNAWAREVGVAGKHVFLYSGTLGLKHDPDVLLRLATPADDEATERIEIAADAFDPSVRDGLVQFFRKALHRDVAQRFSDLKPMRDAWRKIFLDMTRSVPSRPSSGHNAPPVDVDGVSPEEQRRQTATLLMERVLAAWGV